MKFDLFIAIGYDVIMQAMQSRQPITQLRQEVKTLWSFVIGFAGKDPEGKYRPEFVEKILKLSSKKPTRIFTNADSFLNQVSSSK